MGLSNARFHTDKSKKEIRFKKWVNIIYNLLKSIESPDLH